MPTLTVPAAVCRRFGEPLTVEEVRLRRPVGEDVLVRVSACSICHSDVAYADGAWGGDLPAVYGHEAAGTVVEVGPATVHVAVGARVVVTLVRSCGRCRQCDRGLPALCEAVPVVESPLTDVRGRPIVQGLRTGAFASHVLVHGSQVVPIADDVAPEIASLLGCGVLTGVGSVLRTAGVEEGASVAVVGVGGVGLSCVQGAAIANAGRIVAVDLVASKLETALAVGATDAVDATDVDPVAAVRALTDGLGVDYVLVAAAAKHAFETGLRMLGRGGTAVVVGMPASGVTIELDATDLADKGQRLVGSKLGSSVPHVDVPWLLDRYREGRLQLDRLISGSFALEEVNHALESTRSGDALRNVLLFEGLSG